jgi:inhibitor of cysteine peptidase
MKRVYTLVAILVLAAMLVGLSACNRVTIISVAPGDIFEISLDSNPTTGYSWQADFDQEYLELVSQEFVPPQSDLVGAGGTEIFAFQALEVGETKLTLVYKRSWETEAAETRVFIIKISETEG